MQFDLCQTIQYLMLKLTRSSLFESLLLFAISWEWLIVVYPPRKISLMSFSPLLSLSGCNSLLNPLFLSPILFIIFFLRATCLFLNAQYAGKFWMFVSPGFGVWVLSRNIHQNRLKQDFTSLASVKFHVRVCLGQD